MAATARLETQARDRATMMSGRMPGVTMTKEERETETAASRIMLAHHSLADVKHSLIGASIMHPRERGTGDASLERR